MDLTIGMLTHDDFNGVYFSIQSILTYHTDVVNKLHFVVIDNNPDSEQGKATAEYCKKVPRCHYSAVRGTKSTALRNLVFELSPAEYVLCMDCHCFLDEGALASLLKFYALNPMCHDLLHGPLLDEVKTVIATEMHPGFRGHNFGVWHTDKSLANPKAEPKEIIGHGMGLFACSRDGWMRFTPGMREFGGEELIIHEKFRLCGRSVWCMPFLRWIHRFQRPGGVNYPLTAEAKCKNIMMGFNDVHLPLDVPATYYSKFIADKAWIEKAKGYVNSISPTSPLPQPGYVPFMGKKVEMLD